MTDAAPAAATPDDLAALREARKLDARSVFLWTISLLHFVPATIGLLLCKAVLPMRLVDPLLRLYTRNVTRLAGMRIHVHRAPGFDPERVCFFMSNHVNLFDPFVLNGRIPQLVRGLELESHFKIPVYGWLMKGFGNVPVPDRITKQGFALMHERTKAAIDAGTSLIVFPEGSRTRTGRLGKFRPGVFRIAAEIGAPIVPVTIVGAFDVKNVHGPRFVPGRVDIYLHDPIETKDASPEELQERVRETVNGPLTRRAE